MGGMLRWHCSRALVIPLIPYLWPCEYRQRRERYFRLLFCRRTCASNIMIG